MIYWTIDNWEKGFSVNNQMTDKSSWKFLDDPKEPKEEKVGENFETPRVHR